ncbi:DUF1826 domain-containing protein [Novosphingobium sp. RD2P27]|uniref:DUF1826 domain-containing protein n=1 Tax=Novosphingobium kalidii TaxID=3230299 RepID=A0ABV2D1L7_9SPHN
MARENELHAATAWPDALSRSEQDTQDAVAVVHALKDTRRVLESHVALAVWKRELPSSLLHLIDRIDLNGVDDVDVMMEVAGPISTLAASLLAGGYPEDAAMRFADDMLRMARQLASFAGAKQVRMRLEVVETDACRKFHADYVTLRLLTTYRGPATQWFRTASPEVVKQVERGEVAVLKGRLLMTEPTILHRSPPIEATGERRLLLTIDPPRENAA